MSKRASEPETQNTALSEDGLDPLAETILALLQDAEAGQTITPTDAARAYAATRPEAKKSRELWRRYLPAARQQALFLARRGDITIYRRGVPQDPHAPIKGLIRLGFATPQS